MVENEELWKPQQEAFEKREAKKNAFIADLKALIAKHKVTIDVQLDYAPSGEDEESAFDVLHFAFDGEVWLNDTYEEIMQEVFNE